MKLRLIRFLHKRCELHGPGSFNPRPNDKRFIIEQSSCLKTQLTQDMYIMEGTVSYFKQKVDTQKFLLYESTIRWSLSLGQKKSYALEFTLTQVHFSNSHKFRFT